MENIQDGDITMENTMENGTHMGSQEVIPGEMTLDSDPEKIAQTTADKTDISPKEIKTPNEINNDHDNTSEVVEDNLFSEDQYAEMFANVLTTPFKYTSGTYPEELQLTLEALEKDGCDLTKVRAELIG